MDDLQYYRRRLAQEQQAVRDATCEAARERHQELAAAYRFRSRLIRVLPPIGAIEVLGHELDVA